MSNTPRTDKYRGTWATTAQDGKFIFQLAQELEDENTELRQQLEEARECIACKVGIEEDSSCLINRWANGLEKRRIASLRQQLAEALEAIAIKAGIKGE